MHLLQHGFPVDEAGGTDGTPLNRASICGYVDIVRFLITHGASLTQRNVYGGVPLTACIWGSLNFRAHDGDYPATAEALLSAGAPLPDTPAGSPEVQEVLRESIWLPRAAFWSWPAQLQSVLRIWRPRPQRRNLPIPEHARSSN